MMGEGRIRGRGREGAEKREGRRKAGDKGLLEKICKTTSMYFSYKLLNDGP